MFNNKNKILVFLIMLLLVAGCSSKASKLYETDPGPSDLPSRYSNVGVHDPAVVKGEDRIFIIGSHLDAAHTYDYVNWQRYGSGVKNGNPVIPNVEEDMKEALEWAETSTFWAGDIIRMKDGKYYYYYSVCEGSQPLSAIGYAVADKVEGPYVNQGLIMKSGRAGKLLTYEPDRNIQYDPNIHPNAIDPTVFYDHEENLWMVYGSYSGGIFILQMDEKTKMPVPGQGYGTRLMGGKHTRIENPYIIYDENSEYYYLYTSYGGLGSGHGYQTRVARSKQVDGPYKDIMDQNVDDINQYVTKFFDDEAISPFGNKVMGDFEFVDSSGNKMGHAYISPGGASFIYDKDIDRTLMIFHTRFPRKGEAHEIRTHEIYMNEEGWPVVAPIRYSGKDGTKLIDNLDGVYQYILNTLEIIGDTKISSQIKIDGNQYVTEDGQSGKVEFKDGYLTLELSGTKYKGVALQQWDSKQKKMVKTITLQGDDNTSLWAIEE